MASDVRLSGDEPGVLYLPDWKGREHAYRLRAATPQGLERRAWLLERLDTGALRRVALCRWGWCCDCEAFRYGTRRPCKHVGCCMALEALTRGLGGAVGTPEIVK